MTQANEQLRVDLEKWHEATNKEMSQLMREVADNHIGYHQKVCGGALRCDKCSHIRTFPLPLSFLLPLPFPHPSIFPFSLLFTLPLSPPRSVRLLQHSVLLLLVCTVFWWMGEDAEASQEHQHSATYWAGQASGRDWGCPTGNINRLLGLDSLRSIVVFFMFFFFWMNSYNVIFLWYTNTPVVWSSLQVWLNHWCHGTVLSRLSMQAVLSLCVQPDSP